MRWTEKEINYLKKNYPSKTLLKDISKTLKRSKKAICHKAVRLNLSRPRLSLNRPRIKNYRNNYDKKYYLENKEKIYKNKLIRIRKHKKYLVNLLGGKCRKCGYKKCLAAFDFHHVSGNKEDNLNRMLRDVSKKKVLKEVNKCLLLCSNCHRELHYGKGAIVQ